MAATYQNISIEEMMAFLSPLGFQTITVPGTREIVFGKRVPHSLPLTLRVYTGIEGTMSRGVGEDAIRVTLFWRNAQGEVKKAGGSKRVHRVANWRTNLQNRLDNWNQDFVMCSCGSPMVERQGTHSKFLGCCNFPKCKHTQSVRNPISDSHGKRPNSQKIPNLTNEEMRAEMEVLRLESQQM